MASYSNAKKTQWPMVIASSLRITLSCMGMGVLSIPCAGVAPADSLPCVSAHSLNYKVSLSTSYSDYVNWTSGGHDNFCFQSNADISYYGKRDRFRQQFTFRTALSFMQYVDSLWVKATDYWKLNLRFTDQPDKRFTHSYSLLVASQWLNSYRYVRRNDNVIKEKRGSFLNPGNAMLAYGVNWRFWKTSSMNFSFATVKIMTKPRYIPGFQPGEELAKTKEAYIFSEYGMSIQTCISKPLAGNILWENNSTLFANGISRSRVQADFINAVSVRFLKYMVLRIDTHILYEPLYSYKLQLQHGFSIGNDN
jgi:hypothetical protein